MPYLAMAASVSPPPAMLNAADSAIARAMVRVPPSNAANSNTPTGPFQTMVPAHSSCRARRGPGRGAVCRNKMAGGPSGGGCSAGAGRRVGADVQNHVVGRYVGGGFHGGRRVGGKTPGHHHVGGNRHLGTPG